MRVRSRTSDTSNNLRKLTAHLLLACLLPVAAGEAWADELHRAAQLRVSRGEPSILSTLASHLPTTEDVRLRASSARASVGATLEAVVEGIGPALASSADGKTTSDLAIGKAIPDLSGIQLASVNSPSAPPEGSAEPSDQPVIPPVPRRPASALGLGLGTPWHLLSVPDEPDNVDPAVLLPAVANDPSLAYTYDACDSIAPWKVYDPADLPASDLTAVDHRGGFWLKATAPDPLAVSGTEPAETSIQLCEGWNLIGYPLAQDRPVLAALSSIFGKFLRVYGFDPTTPKDVWKVYDVGVPDWANTLRTMERGRGYWVYATEDTTLQMRNVGPPPEVEITSPEDGGVVTFLTDVVGTAYSDLLERWELAHRSRGTSAWTIFATGDTPVIDDVLAVFDPTLLMNGLYEIRLEATDFAGRSTSASIDVVVEGNAKIGHFTLTYVDLEVPVAGIPIEVYRRYDSRDKETGDFGVGWTLELSDVDLQENRPPGLDWQGSRQGIVIPSYCIEATEQHIVTITLPDDTVHQFRPTPVPQCQIAVPPQVVDIHYVPLPGTVGTLVPLDQTDRALVVGSFPGPVQLWDQLTTSIHDPDLYELTLLDGRVLVVDEDLGLVSLTDVNGNRLRVDEFGISHSSGKGIVFERDAENRITSITDPMGNVIRYEYDARGDLINTTNQEEQESRYEYEDHRIVEIFDPDGGRAVRADYGDDGRLVRVTDALGNTIEIKHDLGARREVLANRLGFARILEYDERGNVVRETDELGNVTVRTFDATDRLLTETDPAGGTLINTYDSDGNVIEISNSLGHATRLTYDDHGNRLTIADPRGKVITNTYDDLGNLLTNTDPLGEITSFAYDGDGNLTTQTDALGNVTSYDYDGFGNRTRIVDAAGTETVATYDANGNRLTWRTTRTTSAGVETLETRSRYNSQGREIERILPDGSIQRTGYNSLGLVDETLDSLGRATRYTYDAVGLLTGLTYPDGTVETRSYDAEGNLVSAIDRGGREARFEYDRIGRLLRTTYADGSTMEQQYDGAGRPIAIVDARGNTSRFSYDAAGRQTEMVDALGQRTTFVYDPAGNPTGVTDARGHLTRFEYDDVGRLVRTIFAGGTEESVGYDALDRRISQTDAAGRLTRFTYDSVSRLVQVTDAMGGSSRYEWDEQANLLSQTDANGHTTRFEFDSLGRPTRRVLPDGASESFVYDLAGNRVRRTDFNGEVTNFSYDVNNRLVSRSYSDGSSVDFTYTPTGRRTSAVDARGTTSYVYDQRDRLIRLTFPDGREIRPEWDGAGNRSALSVDLGAAGTLTTSYTYDAMNRLASVVDPQGGTYSFSRDEVGNPTLLTYPNLVATSWAYDSLNRLQDLTTRRNDGEILQSQSYTTSPTGHRLQVTEQDGTRREYQYDDLDRLTGETVVDGSGASVYGDLFVYDPAGNRLRREHTDASGATATTTYTYDDRDRLQAAGVESFTWDDNGNLTGKSGPEAASYAWDFENRLVNATLADGTVRDYTYDGDGVRVATMTTPPSASSETTEHVVDTSGSLSQLVAEIEAGGALSFFTYGLDLLGSIQTGGNRFYHSDGLGSIRALTDPAAVVTDRYSYQAFGEPFDHLGTDPNAFLFAGALFDPVVELYHLRARWMAPEVGRFVSMDPVAGLLETAGGLHSYVYALNDPVNRIDPSGLQSVIQQLTTIAMNVAVRVQGFMLQRAAAFLGGASSAWKFRRQIGAFAEAVARQVIALNPLVLLQRAYGLLRVRYSPDFFLRAANGVKSAFLEVKWNLPWARGGALNTIIQQVRTGLQSGFTQEVVLWSLRTPTAAQVNLLQRALGINYQYVTVISGVRGLFIWMNRFFGRFY